MRTATELIFYLHRIAHLVDTKAKLICHDRYASVFIVVHIAVALISFRGVGHARSAVDGVVVGFAFRFQFRALVVGFHFLLLVGLQMIFPGSDLAVYPLNAVLTFVFSAL